MPAGSGTWRVGAGSWRASCAVTAPLALVAEPQLVDTVRGQASEGLVSAVPTRIEGRRRLPLERPRREVRPIFAGLEAANRQREELHLL